MMKWAVGALIVLLVAFVFNLGLLVYAMYALLAVLLIGHYVTSNWVAGADAQRRCPQLTAEIGQTVPVLIKVRNTGRLTIWWTLIEDLLPADAIGDKGQKLRVTGKHIVVTRLKAGEVKKFDYQLKCLRRGYYQIGPLVLETGDLFGLHRRYRVLAEPHFLLVRPKIISIEGYEIASRRPLGEIVMSHRLFEDPTRVAGIRQYQPGDPLSRVHWRSTARTGQLQSKVFEPSSLAGATLLIDFHLASFDPANEPVRSELSITAAASLANAVHEMGQQIGVISNGRDAVDRIRTEGWRGDRRTRQQALASAAMKQTSDRLRPVVVPTKKDPNQMVRISQALARLELSGGLSFPQLVIEAAARLPRDATVIAFLSSVDTQIGVALGQLRRSGYAVTAVLNLHDEERFAHVSGILLAEGISSRQLKDEDSIPVICQKQVLQH